MSTMSSAPKLEAMAAFVCNCSNAWKSVSSAVSRSISCSVAMNPLFMVPSSSGIGGGKAPFFLYDFLDAAKQQAVSESADAYDQQHHRHNLIDVIQVASGGKELSEAQADKDHFSGNE